MKRARTAVLTALLPAVAIACSPTSDARPAPAPAPAPAPVELPTPRPAPLASRPAPVAPAHPPPEPASSPSVATLVDVGPPFEPEERMPRLPRSLNVPGFHPAVFVGPSQGRPWPRPVVVVLHGRDNRPEDECAIWQRTVGDGRWVLCPRGEPSTRHPGQDRWTWPDASQLRAEVEATIEALELRFPGQVAAEGRTLAGFSLGANLAPWVASQSPGLFTWLIVVEGTFRHLDEERVTALRVAGIEGVGLFMSVVWRIERAAETALWLEAAGMTVELLDMRGAGHAYRPDFPTIGRDALERLWTAEGGLHAAVAPPSDAASDL